MNSYIEDLNLAKEIAKKVSLMGGKTYFVGGFVRDLLMNKEPNDIDIEIFGIEELGLREILSSLGSLKDITSSFEIYNLTGSNLDITLPRNPDNDEINPFASEIEAAKRRDFTMNTVMKNVLSGEILDFYGGAKDIENKIIRATCDESFSADTLRVFRMADFCARFNFKPDEHTKELALMVDLSNLKRERVFEELKKALLKSEKPSVFFETLREINALDVWFPELKALINTEQNPKWHPEGNVWNHTMLVLNEAANLKNEAKEPLNFMLSALFHDLGKAVATTVKDGKIISHGHDVKGASLTAKAVKRLTNNKSVLKYTTNMTELHMRPNGYAAQNSSQKAFNKLFYASICPEDLLLLSKADHMGRGVFSDYSATEELLKQALSTYNKLMSEPYVTGKDLIDAGIKPDENFSKLLDFANKLRLSQVPYETAFKQVVSLAKSKSL